ncbi:DUF4446 family protein [Candidatus Giovannonibacteria bacterium]|nr:DUF4446 family protein [Candidatus Giovannonibacteria bacterium]
MTDKIIIYSAGLITLVSVIWVIFLEIRLRKVFGGKKPDGLEEILKTIAAELKDGNEFREEMEKYLENVEKRLRRSAQHVGIVRFNPFPDAGGDQSFAIAIMDEKKSGVVLSSLYGRDTSRIYAKPLENASSHYQLSNEELKAIEEALKK